MRGALALLLLLLAGPAFAQAPGAQFPSQQIAFTDALAGKTVIRLTVDGAQTGGLHQAPGDESSESSAWAPDSGSLVYTKTGVSNRPAGVYRQELASGVETYLAPAAWGAYPTFSRDGREVYYYTQSGTTLTLRAVLAASPYTVRTLTAVASVQGKEKITVNADGSLVAIHPRLSNGSYRTVILDPATGIVLANWTPGSSVTGDDGTVWHPTDPKRLCAKRGSATRVYHVDTLATSGTCWTAHSAWHPNGIWFYTPNYLKDLSTGQNVVPGTGAYSPHPNIAPTDAALGLQARIVLDDGGVNAYPDGRAKLYAPTLTQALQNPGDWRKAPAAKHYSSGSTNSAHPHPTWSPDGRMILWTTDTKDLRDGAPPGPTGQGTDLFVVVMVASTPPPAPPDLQVIPLTLAFTMRAGDPAPGPQTVTVTNGGGGTLSWAVIMDAPWLNAAVVAEGLAVTVNPDGLAVGTYTGTVTIMAASGTLHSPQVVGVTFTISPPPPPAPPQGVMGGVLTWPAVPGATSYVTERRIHDGAWAPLAEGPESFVPIPPPVADCFRVRALGPGGLGEPGPEVCR